MDLLALSERVIRSASRARPADEALRAVLKSERNLSPGDAAQVARMVFAYYRWHGWLAPQKSPRSQVHDAVRLAAHFAREPQAFSDGELLARAVPPWAREELEITAEWARSLQSEPRLWLRAKPGQGARLAARLGDGTVVGAGVLSDTLEYTGTKDLFRTPEFHAGEFEVQDLCSQAVGWICAPQPGETWWDACAGEGGKLLHLSALMANKGLIWASDRAAWRLRKLKRRAARAKVFNYRAAAWDGGPRLPTKTRFAGVLVDAPCSGVGTWQRNPHARWTTTPEDVRELAELQQKLLAQVAPSLKPGGKLVYSVCTLTRAETLTVVERFEQQFSNFERLPLRNPLDSSAAPRAHLELWPHPYGGNGMFIAAWRRRAG